AGLPAVALFAALVGLLGTAALVLLARDLGATPPAAALMAAVTGVALDDGLGARPHRADDAPVPLLLVLLLRWHSRRSCTWGARQDRHCPAMSPPQLQDRRGGVGVLAAIGALHVAWVNLHSTAPLGVAACAVFGVAHAVAAVRGGRW